MHPNMVCKAILRKNTYDNLKAHPTTFKILSTSHELHSTTVYL